MSFEYINRFPKDLLNSQNPLSFIMNVLRINGCFPIAFVLKCSSISLLVKFHLIYSATPTPPVALSL